MFKKILIGTILFSLVLITVACAGLTSTPAPAAQSAPTLELEPALTSSTPSCCQYDDPSQSTTTTCCQVTVQSNPITPSCCR